MMSGAADVSERGAMAVDVAPAAPTSSDDAAQGDNAKRRQIVTGARKVFLERGFEGASMGEIARCAGVSKGTLYAYFENKEQMFCAILDEERRKHLGSAIALESGLGLREALTTFGVTLTGFITDPAKIAAMRTAMAIAERMPEVGRSFYERGPGTTTKLLAGFLDRKVAEGELQIEDTGLAAAQFLDLCNSSLVRPALFGIEMPREERLARIDYVVRSAVDVFLRAYTPR
jgi:AcrR family transcriptional regulator